jgi:hypothetical protein
VRWSRRDEVSSRDLAAWRAHLVAIRPDADVAEANWWETVWSEGTPPAVGFLIPRGFEAYARVLHPADRRSTDESVSWATVARENGTTLHPQAQFHALARRGSTYDMGGAENSRGWHDLNPEPGVLARPRFEALAEVLSRHTTTPDDTFVAFWVGHGVWPRAWDDAPTTRRPVRESYLFRRALSDVPTLCAEAPAVAHALATPTGVTVSLGGGPPPTIDEQFALWAPHQWQSPSAWWPADHAWVTSNDTDLDSTLVGGPLALVEDLVADDRLEVLPWPVDGSLWADADTVNL